MVDECKGSYYRMELGRYEPNEDGNTTGYINWHLITFLSCESDECTDCFRMRLVMDVNLCDYSVNCMMEEAPTHDGIYKLEYDEEDDNRHLTQLVKVKCK